MKLLFTLILSLPAFEVCAQIDSCKIFRDSFESVASKLPDSLSEEPNQARFDKLKLANMRRLEGYEKATSIITWIQSSLEHYQEIHNNKQYWRLRNFDDTFKMLDRLRKECPTINLKVYEAEIAFYQAKHRPYDPTKPRNEQ